MITDFEILKLVMERYPEQNTSFIIEQFTALKAGIIQANSKLAVADTPDLAEVIEENQENTSENAATNEEQPAPEPEAPRKKFSKRDLKVKPGESIGDDFIKCCLCGRSLNSLTARHLNMHGISVEEYKKLCGFDPKQPLMSREQYQKMCSNIERALAAKNRVIN